MKHSSSSTSNASFHEVGYVDRKVGFRSDTNSLFFSLLKNRLSGNPTHAPRRSFSMGFVDRIFSSFFFKSQPHLSPPRRTHSHTTQQQPAANTFDAGLIALLLLLTAQLLNGIPPRTREKDTKQFSTLASIAPRKSAKTTDRLDRTDGRKGIQTHAVESIVDREPIFSI